jgi:hypothetical protein
MPTALKTKPGINGANVLSIPNEWDAAWFRKFINNSLKGADVRNAIAGAGITITGNISSPYATISATGGGGGGTISSITSTDGSVIITNPSGPTTNISVPGQGLFNITSDLHPLTPVGVGLGPNDEFEAGAVIDTTGTRYSGATAWSAFNLGTGSSLLSQGSLVFTPQVGAGVNYSGYTQPAPVNGNWTFRLKISASNLSSTGLVGLLLVGPTGRLYLVGVSQGSGAVQRALNSTTFSSNLSTLSFTPQFGNSSPIISIPFIYFQVSWNSATTTFVIGVSFTGGDSSFVTVLTEAAATFLGTPTLVGLGVDNQASANTIVISDWFRRTA